MRVALSAVTLALAGCDYLFQLDPLPRPNDASTIDVAAGCFSTDDGDEDLDLTPNGCDKCPLISDNQADSDGDGVGNACDANPTMPLEQIAFFHPMTKFNPVEWAAYGPHSSGWMDNENGIQQADKGNDSLVQTYLRVAGRTFDQPMVHVMLLSSGPDDDAGDRSAAAVYVISGDDTSTGLPPGFLCGLEYPDALLPTGAQAFAQIVGKGTMRVSGDAPPALLTISTLVPGAAADVDIMPSCEVAPDAGGSFTFTAADKLRPEQVTVGVWTMNTASTFIGMFVTERRP